MELASKYQKFDLVNVGFALIHCHLKQFLDLVSLDGLIHLPFQVLPSLHMYQVKQRARASESSLEDFDDRKDLVFVANNLIDS
jgi:hypothetical protein